CYWIKFAKVLNSQDNQSIFNAQTLIFTQKVPRMNPSIRAAEEKDIPQILEILNEEILHSTVVYDTTAKTLEQQLQWFEQKKNDNFPFLVVELEGRVLAYGSYGKFRPWEAFQPTIEHSLYV